MLWSSPCSCEEKEEEKQREGKESYFGSVKKSRLGKTLTLPINVFLVGFEVSFDLVSFWV